MITPIEYENDLNELAGEYRPYTEHTALIVRGIFMMIRLLIGVLIRLDKINTTLKGKNHA
jgi:hypothetical protein